MNMRGFFLKVILVAFLGVFAPSTNAVANDNIIRSGEVAEGLQQLSCVTSTGLTVGYDSSKSENVLVSWGLIPKLYWLRTLGFTQQPAGILIELLTRQTIPGHSMNISLNGGLRADSKATRLHGIYVMAREVIVGPNIVTTGFITCDLAFDRSLGQ